MQLQLLSDLHLETEAFDPEPAPGAELLVLAGDVDSGWAGLRRFADWPVPVLYVPGNHEYDRRDFDAARAGIRRLADELGFILLDDGRCIRSDAQGRRVRFVGSTRWSDFELFGAAQRERSMRAAGYFQRVMAATRHGQSFDANAVREEALRCRAWLEEELGHGGKRGRLGGHGRHHPFRTQPAQRRSALRQAARHGQLLQCGRGSVRRRAPVAARPSALPARLPGRHHARRLQRPRPRAQGGNQALPAENVDRGF